MNSSVVSRSEWRWCISAAAAVMALTCLPYLFLWGVTPPGMRFLGFVVNLDDQSVYLAWMKQASEGHFFLRNLWTADPQRGINVHQLVAQRREHDAAHIGAGAVRVQHVRIFLQADADVLGARGAGGQRQQAGAEGQGQSFQPFNPPPYSSPASR